MQIRKKREGVQLDMTPLIDMMFLLIIFFLLATSFQTYKNISVRLPSAETGENPSNQAIIITILEDGTIMIDKQIVSLSELNSYIITNHLNSTSTSIYINADKMVSYEMIIKVLDLLRKNSITSISVGIKPY